MQKLKTALQERQQIQSKEIISKENLNFENIDLFNNEDGEYLKQKSYEVSLITIKGGLALGKIFKEVLEKLGNNKTGTYEKWLEFNGYHKRTALRYRKKYELYQLVSSEKREQIALMSYELIEKISNENINEYVKFINNGMTNEELKEKLINKTKINEISEIEPIEFNFKIFENIEAELKTLDQNKKLKVEKLLLEIKKILNK